HKKVGDHVRRDENLVDLETDKVVLEVPAPADGVIKEIRHQAGDTVNSEQVLAILEEGAAPAEDAPKGEAKKDAPKKAAAGKADAPAAKGAGAKPAATGKKDTSELSPGGRRVAE